VRLSDAVVGWNARKMATAPTRISSF
jgi:hypothetical protein